MIESGIILLNKPRMLSSNTAVNIVKKAVGAKKAGHLGTLDVAAEGLLPVTLNSSTKLFDMFLNKDKTYITRIKFGEHSETLDLEAPVTKTDDKIITKQALEKVLKRFVGTFDQMPPKFSAKKINGKKAYEFALKGEEVPLSPKRITISSLTLKNQLAENLFELEVSCSSGTYIRALARDIAAALSTSAVCYDIIRTRCGGFMLNDAQSLEEIKAGNFKLIKPETLFDCSQINLSQTEAEKLLNGVMIFKDLPDGTYKVFCNEFLGVGKLENKRLHLKLRLN